MALWIELQELKWGDINIIGKIRFFLSPRLYFHRN